MVVRVFFRIAVMVMNKHCKSNRSHMEKLFYGVHNKVD